LKRPDVQALETGAGHDLVGAGDHVQRRDREIGERRVKPAHDVAKAVGTAGSALRRAVVDGVGMDDLVDGGTAVAVGDELERSQRDPLVGAGGGGHGDSVSAGATSSRP
jgi:hypothetical protein